MTTRKKIVSLSLLILLCVAAAPLYAQTYSDRYDFVSCITGCKPFNYGTLIQGNDGYLYGTAYYGGANGLGAIFKVSTDGTTYVDLHDFDLFTASSSGGFPTAGLTLVHTSTDGDFYYGTTTDTGESGAGSLFSYNTTSATFTVLHLFSTTEGTPLVAPVLAPDGNLYGVTGNGTTYRVTLPSGTYKALPYHAPGGSTGPFILASDGNLYDTTSYGAGFGAIFRMNTAGGITAMYNFTGDAEGPLVQGSDGALYGVTSSGGANNTGEIFRLEFLTLPHKFSVLYSFTALSGLTNSDGANPFAGLLEEGGYLYGSTTAGGASGYGTLFKISPSGGPLTKLYDFSGAGGTVPGEYPTTTLMEATDGCYYGATTGGVDIPFNDSGNIYRLCPNPEIYNVRVAGPFPVPPGAAVEIIGNDLEGAVEVTFGGVEAEFEPGSDTYLTAQVPSAAVDGPVVVTLATGLQVDSQTPERILPIITNLDPSSGPVGMQVAIAGGGFAGATKVLFGGVKATVFTVTSTTLIRATVPTGAKTGKIKVTTPNGTATSKETFTVN